MSSTIEFEALSRRLTAAETGVVSAPPMRKKTSWIRSGSAGGTGPGSADGQQHRRPDRAGVDNQAGQLHPAVRDGDHGRIAMLRNESRHPQAQHHGVGMRDHDGLIQVIDAGAQDEIQAPGHRGGHGRARRARAGDEELRQRDGGAGFRAAGPGGTRRIVLDRGNEDVVVALRVGVEERLFLGHRAGGERRENAAIAEILRGSAVIPAEDLVPYPVAPPVQVAVPRHPLLLGTVGYGCAGELGVGDEPAAGEVRSAAAVIHQGQQAVDVDSPERRGLRHRPEIRACGTAGPAGLVAGHVDREVRQRAPEVVERDAVGAKALVVDIDLAVYDDIAGVQPEAGHAGVITDLEDERVGG